MIGNGQSDWRCPSHPLLKPHEQQKKKLGLGIRSLHMTLIYTGAGIGALAAAVDVDGREEVVDDE